MKGNIISNMTSDIHLPDKYIYKTLCMVEDQCSSDTISLIKNYYEV